VGAGNEQVVAQLTDQAARALMAARGSLQEAHEIAGNVDSVLRRSEDNIAELANEGRRLPDAEFPDRRMAYAQDAAAQIRTQIGRGQGGLEEIRGQLKKAGAALADGRDALEKLVKVPDQAGEATNQLSARLDALEAAVEAAGKGIGRAEERLESTGLSLRRLRDQPERVRDREEAAEAIKKAGLTVNEGVEDARGGLKGLRQGLEEAGSQADAAARESAALAIAAHAAMNPTPPSAQRVSSGDVEQALRHRTTGPAQGADQER
jgi:chromosome segregation ATPase